MAVDIWSLLRAGGRSAIDLLEYSVMSMRLEIMFCHLVAEFRNQPTATRALALFDVFCATGAPGRIDADAVLPPRNLRLSQDVERIRADLEQVHSHNAAEPDAPIPFVIPGKHIFDDVHSAITSTGHEGMRRISEAYDPALSPVQNLPGGRMTAGQRMFVDRVWRPQIRSHLVQAGYPRIASIGG